jgi:uncharacterized OB-fold protein
MTTFEHLPPPSLDDPAADDRTQPFWDAAANEQLVAPKCSDCGTFRMPPTRFCPNCLSMALEYEPLPGTGTVYSCVVVHQPLRSGADDHVPYVPALIEADGAPGIRFISNVVDCEPDDVEIGMKVNVVWHRVSDTMTLPLWVRA